MSVEAIREKIEQSETDAVAILRAARASVASAEQALESARRALDVVLGANDPEGAADETCADGEHVGPFEAVFGGSRFCHACGITFDA